MTAEATSQSRGRLDPVRDRYNAFIARYEVAWELVMGALAAAFVVIGFAGDDAPATMLSLIDSLDIA